MERLQRALEQHAKAVSDCDYIIRDAMTNLMTASKMEDIKESKDLKARMNDAAANREIFEIKVNVVSMRIRQLKHENAMKLCGESPNLPYGMDILTFGSLIDHIYEHTEAALIGDPKTPEGRLATKQINAIIKCNPELKKHIDKRGN